MASVLYRLRTGPARPYIIGGIGYAVHDYDAGTVRERRRGTGMPVPLFFRFDALAVRPSLPECRNALDLRRGGSHSERCRNEQGSGIDTDTRSAVDWSDWSSVSASAA